MTSSMRRAYLTKNGHTMEMGADPCGSKPFVRFVTPGDVRDLKNRVDPFVVALDATVAACKGLPEGVATSWAGFSKRWRDFFNENESWFHTAAQMDQAEAYECDLLHWQQMIQQANKCAPDAPIDHPRGRRRRRGRPAMGRDNQSGGNRWRGRRGGARTKDGDEMNGADTGAELVALTRWLQKQVGDKRSRVVLRQRVEGGENQLVREWRLADIVPSELATAITSAPSRTRRTSAGPCSTASSLTSRDKRATSTGRS